jgi:hypothetical protein
MELARHHRRIEDVDVEVDEDVAPRERRRRLADARVGAERTGQGPRSRRASFGAV